MTMTPEQRADVRKRVDNAVEVGLTGWNVAAAAYEAYIFTVPILLDALDTETKRADEAEARAEALERAIKAEPNRLCRTCVHHGKTIGLHNMYCAECSKPENLGANWQFDTARFPPHDKTEQNGTKRKGRAEDERMD